jgi:heme-degrading monooxygenase HmoA
MEKVSVAFIVETEIDSKEEKKYNEWVNNFHIPLVLKSPGMLRARRYQAMDAEDSQRKYLIIFELENEAAAKRWDQGPERKEAHQNKLDNWGEGGFTVNWAGYFHTLDI